MSSSFSFELEYIEVVPDANPLNYHLVVKNSFGEILREHQMSVPHNRGERFATVTTLQKLIDRILKEETT